MPPTRTRGDFNFYFLPEEEQVIEAGQLSLVIRFWAFAKVIYLFLLSEIKTRYHICAQFFRKQGWPNVYKRESAYPKAERRLCGSGPRLRGPCYEPRFFSQVAIGHEADRGGALTWYEGAAACVQLDRAERSSPLAQPIQSYPF